jgi:ABC-2 type transport system ATP-binding protein
VSQQLAPQQWFEASFEQQVQSAALEELTAVAEFIPLQPTKLQLTLKPGFSVSQLLQQLSGVAELTDFSRIQPSLHQLYLTAVQQHNQQQQESQQKSAEGNAA